MDAVILSPEKPTEKSIYILLTYIISISYNYYCKKRFKHGKNKKIYIIYK